MRHELWYTSAPSGLALGTSGYSTVKRTQGMPVQLRELLERMSQYRHNYPPGHPRASENPVVISSQTATIGGSTWHILSRICDAGADHTNRTNFFAHHIAYDAAEGARDPAWLVNQPNTFARQWDHKTEELAQCRELPAGTDVLQPCTAWQKATGDAGWAGAVADAVVDQTPVYLLHDGRHPLAPLIGEVASLIPRSKRPDFTFSTLYHGASAGLNCQLRCVLAGSDEAKRAATSGARVFDITSNAQGRPVETPRVAVARTGIVADAPTPSVAPKPLAETFDFVLPDSFVSGSVPPTAPQHLAPRQTVRPSVVPAQVRPAPTIAPISAPAPEPDASRAWVPVVSGLGGIALCAMILMPILYWYRSENQQQQASIETLSADIDAANKSVAKLKQENTERDKTQDDQKSKFDQSAHDAEMKLLAFEKEKSNAKSENDRLKTTLAENETTIQKLNSDLNIANAAAKNTPKAPAPPQETAPKPAEPVVATEPTQSKLPIPPAPSRNIDYIPADPTKIEIIGAKGFTVVRSSENRPQDSAWDIRQGETTYAKLYFDKTKQPISIRFNWNLVGTRTESLDDIFKQLSSASLLITTGDNKTFSVPLYYKLAPGNQPANANNK